MLERITKASSYPVDPEQADQVVDTRHFYCVDWSVSHLLHGTVPSRGRSHQP
jgi:hypothetical protein